MKYEELLPLIIRAFNSKWGLAVKTNDRVVLREQFNQAKRDTEYQSLRVLLPREPEDEVWLVPKNETFKTRLTYGE